MSTEQSKSNPDPRDRIYRPSLTYNEMLIIQVALESVRFDDDKKTQPSATAAAKIARLLRKSQ